MNVPTKVVLTDGNNNKFTFTESAFKSINDMRQGSAQYNEESRSVRIEGPKGSTATFYDDQQFRQGENFVKIEKLTDDPIEVSIGSNLVASKEALPSGIFHGEVASEYRWVLNKNVKKKGLLERAMKEGLDSLLDAAQKSSDTTIQLIGAGGQAVTGFLFDGDKSTNFRVDNVSSIEFGHN